MLLCEFRNESALKKKKKKKERKKVWDRWEGTHYKGFFWEMGEHIFLEIKLMYNIVGSIWEFIREWNEMIIRE